MLKIPLPGDETAQIAAQSSEKLYIIVEKVKSQFLGLKNRNILGEFQIVRLKDKIIELLDQNTQFQDYDVNELQFRHVYQMCAFPGLNGFSFDKKEHENSGTINLSAFEWFVFKQRLEDFITGRSCYPVPFIVPLAVLRLAALHGKFEPSIHGKLVGKAMEQLPFYLKGLSDFSGTKKQRFCQQFTELPGFKEITKQNYELIFSRALEAQWRGLWVTEGRGSLDGVLGTSLCTDLYKEGTVDYKTRAIVAFLRITSHGALEAAATSRCFVVKSTGAQVCDEGRENVLITIGSTGLSILDVETLRPAASFQLIQLTSAASDGAKLTFKVGQNSTVRLEFEGHNQCLEAHSLTAGYLQLFEMHAGNSGAEERN